MKDPFNPSREMLSKEEADKIKADLDQRWEDFQIRFSQARTIAERLRYVDEMNELMLDGLFQPWEVAHPFLAEYYRKKAA